MAPDIVLAGIERIDELGPLWVQLHHHHEGGDDSWALQDRWGEVWTLVVDERRGLVPAGCSSTG